MNTESLAAITAAVDAAPTTLASLAALITDSLPEGSAGQVLLAARAAQRVRSATVDAVALACEGRLAEAQATADEASAHLATMLKRLATAQQLRGLT